MSWCGVVLDKKILMVDAMTTSFFGGFAQDSQSSHISRSIYDYLEINPEILIQGLEIGDAIIIWTHIFPDLI